MTPPVLAYVREHAHRLTGNVLEVGSYNVNGGVRDVVNVNCGIDMRPGKGVDIVLRAEDIPTLWPEEHWDSIISTESLEHMEHLPEALQAMWRTLKMDGWMLLTMACPGKGRHDHPGDYWRMTPETIKKLFKGVQHLEQRKVSLCWVVQKKYPELDFTEVELLPV